MNVTKQVKQIQQCKFNKMCTNSKCWSNHTSTKNGKSPAHSSNASPITTDVSIIGEKPKSMQNIKSLAPSSNSVPITSSITPDATSQPTEKLIDHHVAYAAAYQGQFSHCLYPGICDEMGGPKCPYCFN